LIGIDVTHELIAAYVEQSTTSHMLIQRLSKEKLIPHSHSVDQIEVAGI